MMKPKIYIRADGNSEIGLGHVIRCLALAEMLKEEFCCIFATRFLTDYITMEAHKVCDDIIKLPESDDHFDAFLSHLSGDEIVVLDNYFFTTDYQRAVKSKGCKLVCIDDMHDKHFVADVVINHAGGVKKEDYSTEPYTLSYLGPEYAIIRQEFLERKNNKDSSSILICFGGVDIHNATLEVLNLLEEKQFPHHCHVVIGDAFLHQQTLNNFIETSQLKTKVHKNLSAQAMANLMSECGSAICPPSTISYEYLSRRGGKLYVKITADNQKNIYDFYIKTGIAFDISELFINDPLKVQQCLETQRKYFDGQSFKRLISIFRRLKNEQHLRLRKAQLSDLDLYFRWVNDPDERQNAISTEPIKYEEHCAWFTKKVTSRDACLWVLEQDDVPVGQIRFDIDRDQKEATISYFVAQEYRGKGMGLSMVKMGLELFFTIENHIPSVNAIVKSTNEGSRKIFDRLGFRISTTENGFLHYTIADKV